MTPVLSGAQQSLTEQLTGEASAAGESAGKATGSKLAKGIATGAAAAAGAVAAGATALVSAAGATAAYGDEIDKTSQKLGVSSTFYQEWDAVLQHSGTSMSSMSASFKKLATASQDASADQQAAFEALGLSMEQVSSMSAEELFTNVISGLQGMEEGTERTALATQLLGKGAQELGPLLNTSAEDTQGMIDAVHELGGVMSEDAVKASAEYQDRLQDMQTSFTGLKNGLIGDLLPVMSDFMGSIADFVTNADLSPITDMLGEAVDALGDFISGLDIEAVGNTFQTVITAIGEVVGTVWDVLSQIFESIKKGISTVTTSLESGGTSWEDIWGGIKTVVQSVADIISVAIETIAQVIAWVVTEAQTEGTIFNTVWENIKTAVSAAADVISEVINLVKALLSGDWKGAWESAKNIVTTIWNTIKTMMTNVWNGIKSTATSVWNGIKNAISTPINTLKTTLSTAWTNIKTGASTAWNSIKNAITAPIETARNTISNILSAVRGFFPIRLGNIFSGLKLPHFKISGGEIPWGIGGKGTAPSVSVEWYAKAMNDPYMFQNATLFGAGERGDEILYGREALLGDIREAMNGGRQIVNYITVNGAENPKQWAYEFAGSLKQYMRMA